MFQHKIFLAAAFVFFANSMVILPAFSQNAPQNQSESTNKEADSAKVAQKNQAEASKKEEKANQNNQNNEKNASAQAQAPQKGGTEAVKSAASNEGGQKKEASSDETIATITAEGDFVVPTYMLPAAPEKAEDILNAPEMPSENKAAAPVPTRKVRELPVMKITQTELTPVSEQMAIERFLTGKTTKTTQLYKEALARQAKQNQLNGKDVSDMADVLNEAEALAESAQESKNGSNGVKNKKRLLLPLRALPKKEMPPEDLSGTKPLFKVISSEMADQVLSDAKQKVKSSVLMPQDIKVTFYPNSAEFSGQTVKWIKAFSLQALNDPRYVIEVRLSNQNPVIQQKRLYVVQRLLMNTGLSAHQIFVNYVNRPEDSLILRMIQRVEDVQTREETLKNGKIKHSETINW